MISDEEVQACIACDWNDSITEIAKELLAYREAERKATSWERAPEQAVARRLVSHGPVYAYYDADDRACLIRRGNFGLDFEDRPK